MDNFFARSNAKIAEYIVNAWHIHHSLTVQLFKKINRFNQPVFKFFGGLIS